MRSLTAVMMCRGDHEGTKTTQGSINKEEKKPI